MKIEKHNEESFLIRVSHDELKILKEAVFKGLRHEVRDDLDIDFNRRVCEMQSLILDALGKEAFETRISDKI